MPRLYTRVEATPTTVVDRARQERLRRMKDELTRAIHAHGGDLAAVARQFGVSRGCIYHRARRFGLVGNP